LGILFTCAAFSCAAGPPAPESVPILIARLNSKRATERGDAARQLGKLGAKARPAVPALARALQDPDEDVRSEASCALRDLGPDAAAASAALVRALGDRPSVAAANAPATLEAIGKPAVPHLVAELKKGERLRHRWVVLRILGAIGPDARDAAPPLQDAFKDKDFDNRLRAAWALVRVAPDLPAGRAFLISVLKHKDKEVRRTASESLARLGPRGKPAVPVLLETIRAPVTDKDTWMACMRALFALWQIGPEAKEAIPALTRLCKDRDEGVRMLAAGALLRVEEGNRQARRALKPLLPDLAGCLADAEPGVPLFAADVLGRLGPEARSALPALRKALESNDPHLWAACRKAIRAIEGNKRGP
jgi:HEAT repeat protein